MSFGRKEIAKLISARALTSSNESLDLLNSFISIIKNTDTKINISKFGVFYTHQTKSRLGRNPKTKKEYAIQARKLLKFRSSKNTKDRLN